jgi:uncharacterized membrane protein YkvA (DUF1232 family)
MSYGRQLSEWAGNLNNDVETTWTLMQDERLMQPGRRYLATALSYILTQLDLIPDHEKAGAVDDALVIRVAFGLAAEHAAKLDTKGASEFARLTNDEEVVREFLGEQLFARLRRYVLEAADKPVRGRTADLIVADAKARADVRRELDQALKKMKEPLTLDDESAKQLELTVKNYLEMKLAKL